MKQETYTLDHLDALASFDEIIDVRSPSEFASDHLPGSVNCPVLDDRQRAEVGTLYKQVSPFEARKIGAAYVAANIAGHLQSRFLDRPKSWQPLVVCWRGGQRSGSLTHIFRRIGWEAQQLEGGYKTYRRLVTQELAERPRQLSLRVICGATGSGKSRVLQAIGRLGEQVLDLEELACHKGSVLGALPGCAQPAQKQFESSLLAAIRRLDHQRTVYVEAESRKIGSLHLPEALIATMRAARCIEICACFDARVDFLLADYAYSLATPEWLRARLQTLRTLHSTETFLRWDDHLGQRRWRELAQELLSLHYDPLYRRSQSQNYVGYAAPLVLHTDDLSAAGIDRLAQEIVSQETLTQ